MDRSAEHAVEGEFCRPRTAGFEDLLARDGRLVYRTKGTSMEPMLRENRDLVVIETFRGRLKPFDVALYKRDGAYVLHRVIRTEEGCYRIRGDNTFTLETVPDGAVLGVLTSFVRKGKEHRVTDRGYRFCVRLWCAIYPIRYLYAGLKRLARKAAAKTGLLPGLRKIRNALRRK